MNYAALNPEYLRTLPVAVNGSQSPALQLGSFSGNCPSYTSTYNQLGTDIYCSLYMLQFRGYFYAGQSGLYTISFNQQIDDVAFIWVGNATRIRSDYSAANADIISYKGGVGGTHAAIAGEYVPFRVAYAQATGPWSFGVSITAPDGTPILGPSGSTRDLVRYSCDGTAPPYLPWGNEV
ncbi:hypothetical protein BD289DRAFT_448060 [Coniella lustricola]|uniref:PA14 domain-containing protein n=1 Tax=Coniella lustricola TaxID=2025994 RepID=A0A2T2ZSI6_9PEZI|nr:hypothetical protein BD289DRAFT_448060 [Coniella lustricola]